jgi:hypothetical protein
MSQDSFDHGEGEESVVLELLDQANPIHIVVVIIGHVPAALAGPREDPFSDVVVDGLLGNLSALNQFADLHRTAPDRACHVDSGKERGGEGLPAGGIGSTL